MKATKSQLIERAESAATERDVLSMALNGFLNGDASPALRKGDYTLRFINPAGAHGGIVMVTFAPRDFPEQNPYTSAHYWENWSRDMRNHCDLTQTQSNLALRELIEIAAKYVRERQRDLWQTGAEAKAA